jgi:hypothetical protein
MKIELRLKAMRTLLGVDTLDARRRLDDAFTSASDTLRISRSFEELSDALKVVAVLAPKFQGAVLPLVATFVREIEVRGLVAEDGPYGAALSRYQTPAILIGEAIETAATLRYVKTEELVDLLLELSQSPVEQIRNKASHELQEIAEFKIDVFGGDHGQGAGPQARIVARFETLEDAELVANKNPILRALANVLSPSMNGATWTYNAVTISRGAVPAMEDVAAMRAAAIALLKRMYFLDASVGYRKNVLRTLDAATRREGPGRDPQTLAMFVRDATSVARFQRDLVATEDLSLLQVIEHNAYWDYYHAPSLEVEAAVLEVRDALDRHSEYQIYKQLIGFEGIFGRWEELKRSEAAWDYSDARRNAAAEKFADEIDAATLPTWRSRILEFAKTRSDDLATFPVFYHFLDRVAKRLPDFALELIALHEERMQPFLIALMRGLWASERATEVKEVVNRWIREGRNLTAIVKSLYGRCPDRLEILDAVIARATTIDDRWALVMALGVAATLHGEGVKEAKASFFGAMRALAKAGDTRWARDVWHNREIRQLISELEPAELGELLESLAPLRKIDYHDEEILQAIGKKDPKAVLAFLVARLARDRDTRDDASFDDDERFEAIPYQLHKLPEQLATIPDEVIAAARKDFDAEDPPMFQYRGARLVHHAFPGFPEPLANRLEKLAAEGSNDDRAFVTAILRTFEGIPAILGVCRAVVAAAPVEGTEWSHVAAAIESTGVLQGEYGRAESYAGKKKLIEPWLNDPDPKVAAFARWLTAGFEDIIEKETRSADEALALRKHHYGVGKE